MRDELKLNPCPRHQLYYLIHLYPVFAQSLPALLNLGMIFFERGAQRPFKKIHT